MLDHSHDPIPGLPVPVGATGAGLPPGPALVFDRQAIRELDRRAIEDHGLPGIVLMENAARAVAAALLARGVEADEPVVVACGPGNNGGDGWAIARHLANAGLRPAVAELAPPSAGGDAATMRAVARGMGIEVDDEVDRAWDRGPRARWFVDALFGTGLDRPLEGRAARMVERIEALAHRSGDVGATVVAVDVPSGIDADRGTVLGTAVRADLTVTFVGPKPGILPGAAAPDGAEQAGRILCADIGAPAALARALGRPRSPDAVPDRARD